MLSLQNTEAGEPHMPESARLTSCILIKATATTVIAEIAVATATVEVAVTAAELAAAVAAAAKLVAVTEVMDGEIEWSVLLPLPLAQPRKPPINGDR